MRNCPRLRGRFVLGSATIVATLCVAGCAQRADPDPIATLNNPSITGIQHRRALEALDATPVDDPATIKALSDVITREGYTVDVREEALNILAKRDLDAAKAGLRRSLPRTESWPWIMRGSQIIAERGWIDLSPALVSSWARPVMSYQDDLQRPEYLALAKLHGPENVTNVVFNLFVESKGNDQGLRGRCLDLLNRLGQHERLVQLLATSEAPPDDAMLIDLRAAAMELGIVPHTREEMLWIRKLREPSRSEFWSRAVQAVGGLSPQRRAQLELRDVPIIVSASLYDPELLGMTADELYQRVDSYLRTQNHVSQESDYQGYVRSDMQRLSDYREELTWGDLAAMLIAIRAIQIPQVVAHLFDYAERDKADTSTEYGGVIALDAKDRFEIREFPPVMRRQDGEFLASQAMLDAAYTSIFHFHLHVQHYRNEKFAGPSYGDANYADSVRANCLVFTFLNQHTLNVDFYRHDRVVIDLGEIKRSSLATSK